MYLIRAKGKEKGEVKKMLKNLHLNCLEIMQIVWSPN